MPRFVYADDIYEADPSWEAEDLYMCYRYITRLVSHAATQESYAAQLAAVRFGDLPPVALAMFASALSDAYKAQDALTDEQRAVFEAARPLDPPVRLREEPHGWERLRRWGLLL